MVASPSARESVPLRNLCALGASALDFSRSNLLSVLPIAARHSPLSSVVVSLEPRCASTENALYPFSLHIVTRLSPAQRGGYTPLHPSRSPLRRRLNPTGAGKSGHNHFRINTYRMSTSVDSKELTEHLSPLAATLTKNIGEGGLIVNQIPEAGIVLLAPSEVEGSDHSESKGLSSPLPTFHPQPSWRKSGRTGKSSTAPANQGVTAPSAKSTCARRESSRRITRFDELGDPSECGCTGTHRWSQAAARRCRWWPGMRR